MKAAGRDWLLIGATGLATGLILASLAALLLQIVIFGAPMISWHFLTASASSDMTSGGIGAAIFGTVALTFLMTLAGVPVGVATAVYLHEYAPSTSRLARIVRAAFGAA